MPYDGSTFTTPLIDVLLEGKRRINKNWVQGPSCTIPKGGVCVVLAVSWQNNVGQLIDPILNLLARAISDSENQNAIVPWNDTPGRTKEEVLEVFDRAISLAKMGS